MTSLKTNAIRHMLSPSTLSGAVFYAVVFLLVAVAASRLLHSLASKARKSKKLPTDRAVFNFIVQLAHFSIFIGAFTLYAYIVPPLRALGGALLAGAGILSVVLGLAAQSTLGNLVAGASLALYRPFETGDKVQVSTPTGTEIGVVESLNLGYTVLQTYDNRRIVIPNSVMVSQTLINMTSVDPKVMASVPIGISYDADIDRAREIILSMAKEHPNVIKVISCPVTELGDSSVILTLRAWCPDAFKAKDFEFDMYEGIKKKFDEEHIEIPYPYTNVILHGTHGTK